MDWLKSNWFLLAAILSAGIAWGSQEIKVQTLEDAVKSQAQISEKVDQQAEKSAAIDERTKMMQQMLQEQQALIIKILTEVKK